MNTVQRTIESAVDFCVRGIELWGKMPSLRPLAVTSVLHLVELKIIHLEVAENVGDKVVRKPCQLALNPITRRIVHEQTTPWLIGDAPYQPTNAKPKAVYAPLALLSLPAVLSIRNLYREREERRGLSRYADTLIGQIGLQLDAEMGRLLLEALLHDWDMCSRWTRTLSFEDAKRFLGECQMIVCHVSECMHIPLPERVAKAAEITASFHWFHPEHGHIGQCYISLRKGPLFRVYGTEFSQRLGGLQGYNVFDLFNCYTVKRDDTRAADAHAHAAAPAPPAA